MTVTGVQIKFMGFKVKFLTESNDLKVNKTLLLAKAITHPTHPTHPSTRILLPKQKLAHFSEPLW